MTRWVAVTEWARGALKGASADVGPGTSIGAAGPAAQVGRLDSGGRWLLRGRRRVCRHLGGGLSLLYQ
jgi:hypothetical protein